MKSKHATIAGALKSIWARGAGAAVIGLLLPALPLNVAAQANPLTVTCSVEKYDVWPPNHKLADVGLQVTVTDSAPGATPTYTVEVWSTQDDVDATSTRNFSPDAKYDPSSKKLRLRAERSGTVDGRVYLIIVRATDQYGNRAHDCCTVVLPHDRSEASTVSIDAQAESAHTMCDQTGNPPPGYVRVGEAGAPVIGPKQ